MVNPGTVERRGNLDVGEGQTVYWEDGGNPDGVPVLYLHGGPGGTLGASRYTGYFDQTRVRTIAMDQRGCGRSTPLAIDSNHDLDRNTTNQLIKDCEALREHLGVDRWIVSGVSWGTTLSLAYALAHPERTLALSLMAVTTTSREEVTGPPRESAASFRSNGSVSRHTQSPQTLTTNAT